MTFIELDEKGTATIDPMTMRCTKAVQMCALKMRTGGQPFTANLVPLLFDL